MHLNSFLRSNKQVPSSISDVFLSWMIIQAWVNSLIQMTQDKFEIAAGSYVTTSRKKWTNIFKLCMLSLVLTSNCCLSDSRAEGGFSGIFGVSVVSKCSYRVPHAFKQ